MAKKVTVCSLMVAIALIFSYVEALLPLDFIAPGIKPGLANCEPPQFVRTAQKSALW